LTVYQIAEKLELETLVESTTTTNKNNYFGKHLGMAKMLQNLKNIVLTFVAP